MNQDKIGKFIAELRKNKKLTQTELAKRIGVSNKTVSKWECGNAIPDYGVFENLCKEFNISYLKGFVHFFMINLLVNI